MRERADYRGGVIYFDVSDLDLEGYNKFIPYLLVSRRALFRGRERFPTARESFGGHESVEGSLREVNLASLCEKYGGGGHARVAAISLGPGDLVRARQVAKEIAANLASLYDRGFTRRSACSWERDSLVLQFLLVGR